MKKIIALLLSLALLLSVAGCSGSGEAAEEEAAAEAPEVVNEYEQLTFNYNFYDVDYEVVYTQAPERAVTLSQFMTEMLLALGLEDRMVGTAWLDNPIYPEFKEAYDSIPVLSDKYPSKEVLYSVEPDFVSGWTSAFSESRVASAGEMMENGIHPYQPTAITSVGSLDALYQDFRDLGRIFSVEEKAEEVVARIQSEIEATRAKISHIGDDEMVRVFAYDSGENEPFICAGGGVNADIIRQAKGVNIFGTIEKVYATVSWEEVVDKNPDVILIVDYGDTSYETKLEFLKNHPALQEVKAVKDNHFVKIGLADLSPGVRNSGAVEILAKGFYPEAFE